MKRIVIGLLMLSSCGQIDASIGSKFMRTAKDIGLVGKTEGEKIAEAGQEISFLKHKIATEYVMDAPKPSAEPEPSAEPVRKKLSLVRLQAASVDKIPVYSSTKLKKLQDQNLIKILEYVQTGVAPMAFDDLNVLEAYINQKIEEKDQQTISGIDIPTKEKYKEIQQDLQGFINQKTPISTKEISEAFVDLNSWYINNFAGDAKKLTKSIGEIIENKPLKNTFYELRSYCTYWMSIADADLYLRYEDQTDVRQNFARVLIQAISYLLAQPFVGANLNGINEGVQSILTNEGRLSCKKMQEAINSVLQSQKPTEDSSTAASRTIQSFISFNEYENAEKQLSQLMDAKTPIDLSGVVQVEELLEKRYQSNFNVQTKNLLGLVKAKDQMSNSLEKQYKRLLADLQVIKKAVQRGVNITDKEGSQVQVAAKACIQSSIYFFSVIGRPRAEGSQEDTITASMRNKLNSCQEIINNLQMLIELPVVKLQITLIESEKQKDDALTQLKSIHNKPQLIVSDIKKVLQLLVACYISKVKNNDQLVSLKDVLKSGSQTAYETVLNGLCTGFNCLRTNFDISYKVGFALFPQPLQQALHALVESVIAFYETTFVPSALGDGGFKDALLKPLRAGEGRPDYLDIIAQLEKQYITFLATIRPAAGPAAKQE